MKTTTRTRIKIGLFTFLCLSTFILLLSRGPKATEASVSSSHLEKADQYYDSNDFEKAISAYQVAINKNPACLDAYLSLGDCLYKQKDYEQAVAAFKKATAIDPKYVWPYVCLSQAYFSAGQYTASIETLKGVESLAPDNPSIYILMGNSYVEMRQYEDAVSMYKRTIKQEPSHRQAHFRLAKVYHLIGQTDSAFKEYKKLLTLDKDWAEELYDILTENNTRANSINLDADVTPTNTALLTPKTTASKPLNADNALQRDRELAELAVKVKTERQKIMDWYAAKHDEVTTWAKKRTEELKDADKIAWARFQQQLVENTVTTKQTYVDTDTYGYMNGYVTQDGYYSGNTWENKQGYVVEDTHTHVIGNPAIEYESTKKNIQTEAEKIDWYYKRLDELRDQKLSELENYEFNVRSRIQADFRRAQRRTSAASSHDLGTIQSVIKSASGKGHVVIDGSVYSEGDTVNTCKIIHIQEDGVIYQKSGTIHHQSLH